MAGAASSEGKAPKMRQRKDRIRHADFGFADLNRIRKDMNVKMIVTI